MATLLNEQKIIKDGANNLNEKIGDYLQIGVYGSAEAKRKQLGVVHARLTEIQFSIDDLRK